MLNVDHFRGVSISPVISKVFEHCVFERHSDYFVTSCNQLGFKKGSSCKRAIYTLKCAVNSTVNICACHGMSVCNVSDSRCLFQKEYFLIIQKIKLEFIVQKYNWTVLIELKTNIHRKKDCYEYPQHND